MSDLQIGLVVLGGVLIGALVLLNVWQDRRARRAMQDTLPPATEDPLLPQGAQPARSREPNLSAVREEPGLTPAKVPPVAPTEPHPAVAPVVAAPAPVVPPKPVAAAKPVPVAPTKVAPARATETARREPGLGASPSAPSASAVRVADSEGPDTVCEAVIRLLLPQPMVGEALLAPLALLHVEVSKPSNLYLMTPSDVLHRSPLPDETYAEVLVSVLLANRDGALPAADWERLCAAGQAFAKAVGGDCHAPSTADVTEHARRLDQVCAALDTAVGLTLVSRRVQPWRVADVMNAARESGFEDDGPGRPLAWRDSRGALRFTLERPQDTGAGVLPTGHLSLLLDVPHAPSHQHAFAEMAKVARGLAEALEADVVDDNGQPLAAGSEAAVDLRLRQIYAQLDANHLKAGSRRALRVFS